MKKIIFSLVSLVGVLMLIAMALPAASPPPVQAADWPFYKWNCSAGDTQVVRVWLGDASGEELSTCDPGDIVNAYVWVEIENTTGTERYAVWLTAGIYVGGTLNYTIDRCVAATVPPKTATNATVDSFNWTCGSVVELSNHPDVDPVHGLVVSWLTSDPGAPQCTTGDPTIKPGPRKAQSYCGGTVIVEAPLVANFVSYNVCFCNNITFTDTTSGGVKPYTSWHWDFDDGDTSTTQNATHHYDEPGTYNVTLTVTDSDDPADSDSQSYNVTVYPSPTASITPDPAEVCPGIDLHLDGNPSGGSGTYTTHSWTGNGTIYLSYTDIPNPVFNSPTPGTYSLNYTVTDDNGCVGSDDITVTVKGPYTLTVTSDGCCSITVGDMGTVAVGGSDNFTVDCCTDVTLTAYDSDVCCEFDKWTGDVPGDTNSTNPITIHIDGDKAVTGHCNTTGPFSLNVTSDGCCPIRVEYGTTNETVAAGGNRTFVEIPCCTDVTLTAYDSDVCCEFDKWTGDVPGDTNSTNPITIHIDGDKAVTGYCNTTGPFSLNVTSDGCCPINVAYGEFSANVSANSFGNFTVPCCTNVTLTADDSDVCCEFDKWTGDVPGSTNSTNPITIHIDGDKAVTGYCNTTGPYSLNVTSNGCCPINVAYDGFSANVSAGQRQIFAEIPCCTTVNLTADDSDVCCEFDKWTGDVPGGTNTSKTITIHIDGDKAVTATCKSLAYSLNVTSDGCCSIKVEYFAISETVDPNTSDSFIIECCTDVTITAYDRDVCCNFGNWTGDVPGGTNTTNPITIHIDGNKDVTGHCSAPFTLVLVPEAASNRVGTTHDLTATVRDQLNNVMEGVAVTWAIESGPGSFVSQDTTTDVSGQVDAVITSSISGISVVTCKVTCKPEVSDTATKTWIVPEPPPRGGGGGGCPEIKYLTVDWDGHNTTEELNISDRLAADLLGPNPDGSHSLLLEKWTHAPTVDGEIYYLIVIRELEEIPPLPENTVAIVAFNVTPEGAVFDKDIFLTLGVIGQLPENAVNGTLTVAYYDDVSGFWEPMDSEPGGPPNTVAELSLSAPLNHFTIYAVLVEVAPVSPPPPAHFVGSGLSIETSEEKTTFVTKTGESVDISTNVANDGGQEGTYTVVLKLDGETVDTETVTLGAGQSQQVSFTLSEMDYGQHEVEVAGLSDEFTTSRTITWWLIIVIIVAIGLIIWGVVWGRRRRRRAAQEG